MGSAGTIITCLKLTGFLNLQSAVPLAFNLGFVIESTSTFNHKTKRIHLFF